MKSGIPSALSPRPSQIPRPRISFGTATLTPSEAESLKREAREASALARREFQGLREETRRARARR